MPTKSPWCQSCQKEHAGSHEKDVEDRFSDYVTKGQLKLHVAYTTDEETARQWKEEVQSMFPDIAISRMDPLSFSVTCHTGQDCTGNCGITCTGWC